MIILGILFLVTYSFGEDNKMDVLATIDGKYVRPIDIAMREFFATNLNPDDYTISVIKKNNDLIIVNFSWSNKPQGFRGSPKGLPGYEVEIDMKEGRVLRKNYTR
jgi:hypothetical protein